MRKREVRDSSMGLCDPAPAGPFECLFRRTAQGFADKAQEDMRRS